MKLIKLQQFMLGDIKVTILGDAATAGAEYAQAILTPPPGFKMTLDKGCIPIDS
jgi:hypothetical protein